MIDALKNVFKRIWSDIKKYKVGIAICVIYYFLTLNLFKASCPCILLTGFPCPGCGITRSLLAILTFRFKYAFETNPASYAWFFLILWFIFFRYIKGQRSRIFYTLLTITAIITIGVYIYGMVKYFPNRIPYVYTTHNLFHYTVTRSH
ncbi:MAG: DUF2752 domain-containing protein [Lachnospiraceae bacterium]|nr:DUF2752 domain-containing protein [Lachnospiraceae bacterium]